MSAPTAPPADVNARYLGEAVHWLRLRLDRLAPAAHVPVVEPVAAAAVVERRSFWNRVARHDSPGRARTSDGGQPGNADAELAASVARLEQLEGESPAPAVVTLARRFGLSGFERELLLLCLGVELDTGLAARCADAQGDPAAPFPTFALAFALFDDGVWEALSPERPLRYWRLVDVRHETLRPLTTSALVADERIVSYCKGLNTLDARVASLLAPFPFSGDEIAAAPPSQQQLIDLIEARLAPGQPQPPPVIHLVGRDWASKHLVAQRVAADIGLPLVRLPLGSLAGALAEIEDLTRLIQREGALLPMAVYVDAHDGVRADAPDAGELMLNRLFGRPLGVAFLDTRDVLQGFEASSLMLDVRPPAPVEQRAAWQAALAAPDESLPARLAGQFDLSAPVIARIGERVRALGELSAEDRATRSWDACLDHVRPQLDLLAERIVPSAGWDDLILPDDELGLLHEIANQVRQRSTVYHAWGVAEGEQRGLGITALFAGESGTGKTMAAEVLGRELGLNVYRIDLSAVVSKYIGETEKNLRRLFDGAEAGGSCLLFDEADALFGKRSEVKDSHDRYANIEINYLLQRLEAFRGLAILATNMKGALDTAFMRRIRFVVSFPFPGAPERERIWRHAFGKGVPVGELDYAHLGRIGLSGGSIRNVSMNASFLAAGAPEQRVTMPLVMQAVRMELRKLNRPFNEADLALPLTVAAPAAGAAG